MANSFRDMQSGFLYQIDPDSKEYEVWFPYSTELVQVVQKGCLVAVKNFESFSSEDSFSLLEIMEALPVHYAISGSGISQGAYPGFVMEAAESARRDWEQEEPEERTTVIRCKAAASEKALQFNQNREKYEVKEDEAHPMIGEEARILTSHKMSEVINEGLLDNENRPVIEPGHLKLDESIPFILDVKELLKPHFGVFGFTGAGKSNLLSNVVAKILGSESSASIVFSDLMGEYPVLLLDLLDQHENAFIVYLDEDSVPGAENTLAYLEGQDEKLAAAAKNNTMIYHFSKAPMTSEKTQTVQGVRKPRFLNPLINTEKLQTLLHHASSYLTSYGNFNSHGRIQMEKIKIRNENSIREPGESLMKKASNLLCNPRPGRYLKFIALFLA